MLVPFKFALAWVIPEIRGLSRAQLDSLIELARQQSIIRIRRYGGYAFVAALVGPFLLFGGMPVFVSVKWNDGNIVPSSIGLAALLTILSSFVLTSVFNGLILKPAIYDLLQSKKKSTKSL
ncbi:hypothetical protein [Burkholderia guangdongensis]|uniref:hypothetical protein n=1 Tax=Burkholderia guangdongensis TaxID=1792500 RepID=UPI0015C96607|nr:hypothetical protein [Burkholderia guangdongensis]